MSKVIELLNQSLPISEESEGTMQLNQNPNQISYKIFHLK